MGTREKRILVVEDDDAIRALLLTILQRRGFKVDTSSNGADAIKRLSDCIYSVILLDMMMPVMSGYEFLADLDMFYFGTASAEGQPYIQYRGGSAGFLNKWEHIFVAWAEAEGLALDYLTDFDLEADPAALYGYAAMLAVGHSEYWSAGQRRTVERFVDDGGRLAIFSGNTCYWKVRWEDGGRRLVADQ